MSDSKLMQELARQELARRQLIAFAWYTYRGYRAARVHKLIAEYLQEVERYIFTGGEEGIGRLMIFTHPRLGKSELVSVRFPPWFLGRNPDLRVILASSTGELATKFSRQARNIMQDVPYQILWGRQSTLSPERWVQISEDSRAANAWDIAKKRGGLFAAGVGGTIIGQGAHLAIIDDPFRNREDAESKSVRERTDNWYRSSLYTRLEKGAAVVLMHQRWHFDDLAGRLLRKMIENLGAERWVVLNLPAIAEEYKPTGNVLNGLDEVQIAALRQGYWTGPDPLNRPPGKPLWPRRFGVVELQTIKNTLGAYEWEALYQQRPQRLEGNLIHAYDIIRIKPHELPPGISFVRYWDLAVSGKESADWLAGAKVGEFQGAIYIRHIAHFPGPWSDARGRMAEVMLRDGPMVRQGIEVSGQQGGYYQEFKRDQRLLHLVIEAVRPRDVGNKEVRAQGWGSRIQDRLIFLVDDGTWDVDGFINECVAFPHGVRDDRVDGVSGGVQMLTGGAGWAAWAQAQVREAGVQQSVDLANLKLRDVTTGKLVTIGEAFKLQVQRAAETGSLVALPQGIDPRSAGNIMADMAALYLNSGQDIKAQIILNERRRLGV